MTNAHVLVVSRDPMLLQTRTLILGANLHTEAASGSTEAAAAMAEHAFDLIVLCYSLSEAECKTVVDVAQRQDHRPKILTLSNSRNRLCALGDDDLSVEKGPYELVKKVSELLGRTMSPIHKPFNS